MLLCILWWFVTACSQSWRHQWRNCSCKSWMMTSNSNVTRRSCVCTTPAAMVLNLFHVTNSPHTFSFSSIPTPNHLPENFHLWFWGYFSNKELVMAYLFKWLYGSVSHYICDLQEKRKLLEKHKQYTNYKIFTLTSDSCKARKKAS